MGTMRMVIFITFVVLAEILLIYIIYFPEYQNANRTVDKPPIKSIEVHINDSTRTHPIHINNPKNTSKLYAVVHVGPHKTGTTSLQASLFKYKRVLHNANYTLPERSNVPGFHGGSKCHANIGACLNGGNKTKPCDQHFWGEFNQFLSSTSNKQRHLIISAEGLSHPKINYEKLVSFLDPWNVRIVMTYRRLHEWLVSYYTQSVKKHCADAPFPGFVEWLSVERLNKHLAHYTFNVADRYRKHFKDLFILNMHNSTDLTTDFYCRVLPQAESICKMFKERSNQNSKLNQAPENLDYWRLVHTAIEKGIMKKKGDSIDFIVEAVKYRQEVTLNLTIHDFPQKCLSQDILSKILDVSLEGEKRLFPVWFGSPDGEALLRSSFEVAAKTKLCSTNTNEILANDDWKHFFKSLRKPPKRPASRRRKLPCV